MKPGANATCFTATQLISVDRVEFSWHARFPIFGPLALSVLDEYASGDGQLSVWLLGAPLKLRRDGETTAGEVLRHLVT